MWPLKGLSGFRFGLHAFALICLIAPGVKSQKDEEICPKADLIRPCLCDREGFDCNHATNEDEIKKAFQAKTRQKALRGLWINGTPLQRLSSSIFNGYKMQSIHLENMKNFPNLQVLTMAKNRIRDIPTGAFRGNEELRQLSLITNQISTLHTDGFQGAKNLELLLLGNNSLTELGPKSLAIQDNTGPIKISLELNQISKVDPTAFDGLQPQFISLLENKLTYLDERAFQPLIARMLNSGHEGTILVAGNPFTCRGCGRYRWLVKNKRIILDNHLLVGFQCTNGRSLIDLTYQSIGCW